MATLGQGNGRRPLCRTTLWLDAGTCWSGPNSVTSNDQGLAIGVLAAYQVPLAGSWMLTPQAIGRWALIEAEGRLGC